MGFQSLRRSLPGTIVSTEDTPPAPVSFSVSVSASASSKMASSGSGSGSGSGAGSGSGSGFVKFARTILLPMFISAVLYLLIFHALLPLYRRHRARYSQYLPLQSNSLSAHLPEALQPSSLRDRLSTLFFRLFLPSTWAFRNRFRRRRESVINNTDAELFDEESGEAMVGFDVQERSRRRDGMERQLANMNAAARTVSRSADPAPDSNPRLSRDLEEGFRDDSDDEADVDEISAGRTTPGMGGHR